MHTDHEACYRAVKSRDRRFDGVFVTAVRTTGIYCRPSCPARTPAPRNVSFFATAAAAQTAGFRACKRCLPDATPGSPDWDVDAAVAGRAMRLVADGVVDREGVPGLAHRLGYTPRHLTRLLTAELGAGPLALARARRAQTARVLIETTSMPYADVAFAAGFSSVRQFNDTVREVYASSPTELRGRRRGVPTGQRTSSGQVTLRLPVRTPFAGRALLGFLARRAVAGIEAAHVDATGAGWYARSLDLPHGHGTVHVELDDVPEPGGVHQVRATFSLADLRDTTTALERVRRLLDADCDPVAVDDSLSADLALHPLVAARPGLRVPGHVDGNELAVRAVLGQQVSVAGARTLAGRLVSSYGVPLEQRHEERLPGQPDRMTSWGDGRLTHLFPRASVLAALEPADLPMPGARARALAGLCAALAGGDVLLDRGTDRADVRHRLLALPGIGPWTADYVALRALGHPDVFLPTDLGVRQALRRVGDPDPEAWAPWRSYALMHLWNSLDDSPLEPVETTKGRS